MPAVIKAFLPSRRPHERKKSRMKHRACLEQHSRAHVTIQEVVKTTNEDRSQEKAPERRPTEMKATKQQVPKCWVKSIHLRLLGDTYVLQRLRKILVPEAQTPMLPVSLEMKEKQGQMLRLNVLCHFVKGTMID